MMDPRNMLYSEYQQQFRNNFALLIVVAKDHLKVFTCFAFYSICAGANGSTLRDRSCNFWGVLLFSFGDIGTWGG
jgi:hypothetical protein